MPKDHAPSDFHRAKPCFGGLTGFAAKLAPKGKMRDFCRRVQNLPDEFRVDEFFENVRVGLRSSVRLLHPQEQIAAPQSWELLESELSQLPEHRLLAENSEFAVYLAKANEIPFTLREVGRAREVTFRQAGEGTGKSLDLDRFDEYYWHLLLWHKKDHELAGAYRAGYTDEILPLYAISGLYTSTLFRYDDSVFEELGPALELGRSFVTPQYQRHYAPLLLLWKGIARLITMRPEVPVLFGAVSISNDYSPISRELIFSFFEERMQEEKLARLIEARRPFRPLPLRRRVCPETCRNLRDPEDLSRQIHDFESDGKGLPVLLRQYVKIGGKLMAFNVDRKFSNVLDGLVVVDLRKTEPEMLERYMGREAAARFFQAQSEVVAQ